MEEESQPPQFTMRRLMFLLLLTTSVVQAQQPDRRAELNLQGRIDELGVSPGGKIWLTSAIGKTYYTEHIDSNWHYGPPIFKAKEDYQPGDPHFDRISFFNEDTAIITGYISADKKTSKKNGYYRTTDGGKSWQLRDFGGDSWIYAAQVDAEGHAWLGGLNKSLYFSQDFGKRWRTIKLPYQHSDRTYALYMADAALGVVGSDANEILLTRDNWKTTESLPTPLDQKQPETTDGKRRTIRISKVQIWRDYLVVTQKQRVYFARLDSVVWQAFPAQFYEFEVDPAAGRLYLVGDSLELVAYNSPNDSQLLQPKQQARYVHDLRVLNGALYGFLSDYTVFRLDADGFVRRTPYTTDEKIKTPMLVQTGQKLSWGATQNQLYLADKKGEDWYRERVFDFYVHEFKLLDDSLAIFWDGYERSYRYDLREKEVQPYQQELPLQAFLSSPLRSFTINAGSRGCFHHENDQISYRASKDLMLVSSPPTIYKSGEKTVSRFQKTFPVAELQGVFHQINQAPSRMPELADFQIGPADVERYEQRLAEELENPGTNYLNRKPIDSSFLYAVPAMLDSLDPDLLNRLFKQREGWTSTTSHWFTMHFVNEAGDSLNVSRSYYVATNPGHLPWIFEYKGQYFACYNAAFSRLVGACLPEDFDNKIVFDNAFLLRAIAGFLWESKE